jgi:hypothetical protein
MADFGEMAMASLKILVVDDSHDCADLLALLPSITPLTDLG